MASRCGWQGKSAFEKEVCDDATRPGFEGTDCSPAGLAKPENWKHRVLSSEQADVSKGFRDCEIRSPPPTILEVGALEFVSRR
ncbi:hypothetical protein N7475_010437 [Penicillium sp. IBT 31633x]|nr:hypothetical protein N7475_010437 [Penicillium sp. IBT 31633x]